MNRKGFTLIELLVVIAVIAILSVLVVPSIMSITRNTKTRLYNQKVEYIISAAELYGSNNPDIFQGTDVVDVPVETLLAANYLKADENAGDACKAVDYPNGCVVDPRDNTILNEKYVTLTKKSVGVVGSFGGSDSTLISSSETLVKKVCDGFTNGSFYGKFGEGDNDYCGCSNDFSKLLKATLDDKGNITLTNQEVDACLIVSNKNSGEVNNWLKYGDSQANWRVLGVYKVDNKISAKMITSGVVK